MTYFKPDAGLQFRTAAAGPHAASTGSLSQPERAVVFLSRGDAPSTLRRRSSLNRAAVKLLGLRRSNPLADPRLEQLRRFAVLLRQDGVRARLQEEAAMLSAGFTRAQIIEVRRMVAGERPAVAATHDAGARAALACLLIGVHVVLFRICSAYFNDGLIGMIATLLSLLSITSVANAFRSAGGRRPNRR